jgi:hypothetical protein
MNTPAFEKSLLMMLEVFFDIDYHGKFGAVISLFKNKPANNESIKRFIEYFKEKEYWDTVLKLCSLLPNEEMFTECKFIYDMSLLDDDLWLAKKAADMIKIDIPEPVCVGYFV